MFDSISIYMRTQDLCMIFLPHSVIINMNMRMLLYNNLYWPYFLLLIINDIDIITINSVCAKLGVDIFFFRDIAVYSNIYTYSKNLINLFLFCFIFKNDILNNKLHLFLFFLRCYGFRINYFIDNLFNHMYMYKKISKRSNINIKQYRRDFLFLTMRFLFLRGCYKGGVDFFKICRNGIIHMPCYRVLYLRISINLYHTDIFDFFLINAISNIYNDFCNWTAFPKFIICTNFTYFYEYLYRDVYEIDQFFKKQYITTIF